MGGSPVMDDKVATNVTEAIPPAIAGTDAPGTPKYLLVLAGGTPGTMIRLEPGRYLLGRGADSGIPVVEPSVSRRHASVRVDDRGVLWVTDMGSSNGTFRNGDRLAPQEAVAVADGDRLRFGRVATLKFVCPDPCEERFQREMFERSVRDGLTGLYQRGYFLDQLAPMCRAAHTRGLGVAVLMLDVDHFKRVNDLHGHPAGDLVLREVAATIRRATRGEDLVARYGGEEFVAALPIATAEQAVERAQRVRGALAERPVVIGPLSMPVTASIGVCFAPPGWSRPCSLLIEAADRFLYKAKHAGRNRVVTGPVPELSSPESQVTSDGECPPLDDPEMQTFMQRAFFGSSRGASLTGKAGGR